MCGAWELGHIDGNKTLPPHHMPSNMSQSGDPMPLSLFHFVFFFLYEFEMKVLSTKKIKVQVGEREREKYIIGEVKVL